MTARPGRRPLTRRGVDWLATVVFLVLLAAVWWWWDPLAVRLGLVEPPAEASGDGSAASDAPSSGDSSTASTGTGDPPASEDGGAPGRPGPPATGTAADDVAEPAPHPGATESALPPDTDEPAPPAPPAPPEVAVDTSTTRTGLRRYTARPVEDVAEPDPEAEALGRLRRSWSAAPADEAALDALLSALASSGRLDEALEVAVTAAEEGAAPDAVGPWIDRLDPSAGARHEALVGAAARMLETAGEARRRDLVLVAAARLDAAAALLDGARLEGGGRTTERIAATAEGVAREREHLLAEVGAVRRLLDAGAPLPDDADGLRQVVSQRLARQDARVAAEGGVHEARGTWATVTTTGGARLASQALAVVEAAWLDSAGRFPSAADGQPPLACEIVGSLETFASRRREASLPAPAWRGAFLDHDDERARGVAGGGSRGTADLLAPRPMRIVALDPRADGRPLDRLWGELAREASRVVLRRVGAEDRLPAWLVTALSVEREGCVLSADDREVAFREPARRRHEVAASLAGHGTPDRSLVTVLSMDGTDAHAVPWAWSLLRFLRSWRGEASGGTGDGGDGRTGAPSRDDEPILAEALDTLVAGYLEGTTLAPVAAFDLWVLGSEAARRSGLVGLAACEKAWRAWIAEQAALDRGDPWALSAALDRVEDDVAARRLEDAAAVLRRVLAADPDRARALELAVDLASRAGHDDEALLAASLLAGARSTSAGSPEEAALRWVRAAGVHAGLAERMAETEVTLRAAVAGIVGEDVAAGRLRTAVRLLDRVRAACPVDGGWRVRRRDLAERAGGPDAPAVPRLVLPSPEASGMTGDPSLWEPTASGVVARCSGRALPESLRGVVRLAPPCTVSTRLLFEDRPGGRRETDPRIAGLLFGADEPIAWGTWGVLVTPAGRVEMARRRHLEWPSTLVGRAGRDVVDLAVRIAEGRLEVAADGAVMHAEPLGERRAGWLALHARAVDVTFDELTVTRTRVTDPRAVWFARGVW